MPDLEFTRALRSFLRSMPTPHIVYDYPNDGALLQIATVASAIYLSA